MPSQPRHFIRINGKTAIRSEQVTEEKLRENFPNIEEAQIKI